MDVTFDAIGVIDSIYLRSNVICSSAPTSVIRLSIRYIRREIGIVLILVPARVFTGAGPPCCT